MAVANEARVLFEPGDSPTVHAEAAITGKRFIAISDPTQPGWAGLANDTLGGNIVCSPAGAGVKAFAVARYDIAAGAKGGAIRGHQICVMTAGAAVVAGVEVESDATGRAITLATGKSCGIALSTTTAAGQDILVALDL